MKRLLQLSALMFGAVLFLAACGEDADTPPDDTGTETPAASTPTETPAETETPDTTPTEAATATEEPEAEGETHEIAGVDYAFEGVPETAAVGDEFTFTNESEAEFHELILFHIPEDEERSIDELLALPEEEANEIVGAPLGVSVAMPGEEGMVVEGELVVEEPGRYVMLCFIPVGADPAAFEEAMQNPQAGPPEVEGGPPHFTQGMVAEFTVE